MEVNGLAASEQTMNLAETSNVAVETSPVGGELGKDEFLNLLVTQLKHQDPLDPTDAEAMVAQLAQFSSLEQMQNVSSQMGSMRQEQALMQSMSMTGKPVLLTLSEGETVEGVLDEVSWRNDRVYLRLGLNEYSLDEVSSIQTQEATLAPDSAEDVLGATSGSVNASSSLMR